MLNYIYMNQDNIFYGIPLGYNPMYQNENFYYQVNSFDNSLDQDELLINKLKKDHENMQQKLLDEMDTELNNIRKDLINEKSYVTTNGDTVHYSEIILDNIPITIKQYDTHVENTLIYPFNNISDSIIKNINIKCNDKSITFKKNSILCSNYILLEIINDIINIWDYDETPRKILQSNGGSLNDGYYINDYNQNKIKVSQRFLFKEWKLKNMSISSLNIYTSNCNLSFESNLLNTNILLKVHGHANNIVIENQYFNSVDVILHESVNVNFSNSEIKKFSGNLNGVSRINSLYILEDIQCEIHGLSTINYNANENAFCNITKDL